MCSIKICEHKCSPFLSAWASDLSKMLVQPFLIPEQLKYKSHLLPKQHRAALWAPGFDKTHFEMVQCHTAMQQTCYFSNRTIRWGFPESSCESLDCHHVTQNRTTVWIKAKDVLESFGIRALMSSADILNSSSFPPVPPLPP